jgi:hypothetical protein
MNHCLSQGPIVAYSGLANNTDYKSVNRYVCFENLIG